MDHEHVSFVPFFITFTVHIKMTCKKSAAKLPMFSGSLGIVVTIGFGSDCVFTSSYCMLLSKHLQHVKCEIQDNSYIRFNSTSCH